MKPKRTIATKHLRGWVPDLPDHRDFLYADLRQPGVRLPSVADLRPGMSPVENQGQLGSCTANALAGALEFLEVKSGQPLVDLSRLFIYYNERAIEHTVASDSGAMIRDGIKTLAAQGVCPEKKGSSLRLMDSIGDGRGKSEIEFGQQEVDDRLHLAR